ncbi:hypothetical protein [Amycolatopsis sp. MtRt-6]|uniref:hypothetical protein n=1 Tax=Amycolatopsis sp. MtRt-6 TaxID=2792782 RepID=UPI001A8FFD14|nr:hypothetical protein [Amycolatopsis sp. MtRt-6]
MTSEDPEFGEIARGMAAALRPSAGTASSATLQWHRYMPPLEHVAAIPGRELVQELYLNDAGDVGLAVFEPLASLGTSR